MHAERARILFAVSADQRLLATTGPATTGIVRRTSSETPNVPFVFEVVRVVLEGHFVDRLHAFEIPIEPVGKNSKRHALGPTPCEQVASAGVEIDRLEKFVKLLFGQLEILEECQHVGPSSKLALRKAVPELHSAFRKTGLRKGRADVLDRESPVEITEDCKRPTSGHMGVGGVLILTLGIVRWIHGLHSFGINGSGGLRRIRARRSITGTHYQRGVAARQAIHASRPDELSHFIAHIWGAQILPVQTDREATLRL